jgi:hypothetical protein
LKELEKVQVTIPTRRNNKASKLPADVGFCYTNVRLMLGIPYWKEFNIGHSMRLPKHFHRLGIRRRRDASVA